MTKKYIKVIDDLVQQCDPEERTKAGLARRLNKLFPKATEITLQTVNNWRLRGIPTARCDAIERAFGYPKHKMRPDAFSPPELEQSIAR